MLPGRYVLSLTGNSKAAVHLVTNIVGVTNGQEGHADLLENSTLNQIRQVRRNVRVLVFAEAVVELQQQNVRQDTISSAFDMLQSSLETVNGQIGVVREVLHGIEYDNFPFRTVIDYGDQFVELNP